jgi:sugar-specific transcriptional regulator TrmB/DNA-binding CsgD family transcriptional regulator
MALRDLGIGEVPERAYRLLIAQPDLSPSELAVRLGVPADAVSEPLAELVELALARVDRTRPAGVRLRNPRVAVAELIEQVEDQLLRRHRRVADTRADLETLVGTPATSLRSPSGVERLEDLASVRERLEELSFYTRMSVYSIQPGGPLSRASLQAGEPLDERGLRRGIDMRIIYDRQILDDEENVHYVRKLAAHGARVRLVGSQLERLVIMDEVVAVVPIEPHNSVRGALVVREPGLVAGFVRLFQTAWDSAASLPWADGSAADTDDKVSDEDREVLMLLASGRTDESAARQLGVSVRHLRRRIAKLLERLNATSRFEAGVEAARRDWI